MIVQAMLVLFFIVLAIFAIPALRDRVTLKLGLRNILRRKGYAAIVIFGLMIGTAVITSSLVVGDTMDNMVESEILKELHLVDETIVGVKPTGEWDYFSTSVFDSVKTQLDRPFIDGLSPSIRDEVPVLDMRTNLSEQAIPLRGIDFGTIAAFGSLIDENGNAISGISSNEILLGKKIADELEVEIGDTLMVFANNTPHFFTAAHVLKEKEIAGSGSELFVDLSTAQELFDKEGMINRILISNDGGVKEGMQYTDDVKNAFEAFTIDNEGLTFELTAVKKDLIEENKEELSAFTDMFLIFGSFSVIAGVILIINIFVMLAEERKSEMGMVRAWA